MTLTELKAWIDANVFTSNNRLNTGASFKGVLNKVAEETYGKVETMIGATALKTPLVAYGSAKGLEIWGTGGAAFGLSNDYLEASVKSLNPGASAPEMEFWNVFGNTRFSWKDGVGKTERMRMMGGNAWLNGNLHVGVGADRTNQGVPLYVGGASVFTGDISHLKSSPRYTYNWVGIASITTGLYGSTFGNSRWSVYSSSSASESLSVSYLSGNVSIWGLDNGLAKLQTPSISLGTDNWNYSSDGIARLLYSSSGNTYHRVGLYAGHFFRFDTLDSYRFTKEVFGQYADLASDIAQAQYSTSASPASRIWTHRKEGNGVDYRFFDWDGTSARDWWNVVTGSNRFVIAGLANIVYGVNMGIGTAVPDSSAILDLTSTDKGLLLPRLTTTQRNAVPVSAARKGLLIINVTTNKLNFYNGSAWEAVTSA